MKGNKFDVIGTVGVPGCYGGFESLVENIIPSELIATVYCSSVAYKTKKASYKGTDLYYINLSANGKQSVLYDGMSILRTGFFTPNNLLVLGVSGAIFLPVIKLLTNKKVVTNIDGIEWRRDKWGKIAKKFLKFSERIAVNFSDVIISDNEAIKDYVLEEYNVASSVIAYGGNPVAVESIDTEDTDGSYALSICRIEPENNVHLILEAFSQMDKQIVFIGNWDSSEYGKNLKLEYSSLKNVNLIDPIYDSDLLHKYRKDCGCYIHGHSAGGTNPSLVEMMHYGKVIYAFDCIYNVQTTEGKARYFNSASDLCCKIEKHGVGKDSSMSEIASRRYIWSVIKDQYERVLSQ